MRQKKTEWERAMEGRRGGLRRDGRVEMGERAGGRTRAVRPAPTALRGMRRIVGGVGTPNRGGRGTWCAAALGQMWEAGVSWSQQGESTGMYCRRGVCTGVRGGQAVCGSEMDVDAHAGEMHACVCMSAVGCCWLPRPRGWQCVPPQRHLRLAVPELFIVRVV